MQIRGGVGFAPSDWTRIIYRASTISERLEGGFVPEAEPAPDSKGQERLTAWRGLAPGRNEEKFKCRLALDGLDIETVSRVLGAARAARIPSPPAWSETLKEAIQLAAVISAETSDTNHSKQLESIGDDEGIPFKEISSPFVRLARRRLRGRSGTAYSLLAEQAHSSLESSLLRQLSQLGAQAFYLEFKVYRACCRSGWARWLQGTERSESRDLYQAFTSKLLGGGLYSFFSEYSLLARLMATVTDLWIEAMEELILRLHADWSALQLTFGDCRSLGQIVAAEAHRSDRHNGGRAVVFLTFASGVKLVYKPRDLGIEQSFFRLLDWLNRRGLPLCFKTLKILNRKSHGWVEFAAHLPCQSQAEVDRYFQRVGMLLGIVYAMQGSDCHYENIISSGEYPILVDAEMLMQPRMRAEPQSGQDVREFAYQQILNSVIRTGILPRWESGPDNSMHDVSGLGGAPDENATFRVIKWRSPNTDAMALEYIERPDKPRENLPSLNGGALLPSDHAEDIVSGFCSMYRFLIERRNILLDSSGPFADFEHQRIRFVMRPTATYADLLKKLRHPYFLRDAADACIGADVLACSLLTSDQSSHLWPVLKKELEALVRLDTPHFSVIANECNLRLGPKEHVDDCFESSGFDVALSCIHKLGDEDLERQVYLIRAALRAHGTASLHRPAVREASGVDVLEKTAVAKSEILQHALHIATDLQERAIFSDEGAATWIGLAYLPVPRRYQLQPIGCGLFDGSCGLSLFFAALERVSGEKSCREMALAPLVPLRKNIREGKIDEIIGDIDPTSPPSCGTIIYALVKISRLLNEPDLMADAGRLASYLTPGRISLDHRYDIIFGSAAAILGLLALDSAHKRQSLQDTAVLCGQHLLDQRVLTDSGFRVWKAGWEHPLTGFSHGAAGIAYALMRLYELSRESRFREAALEAYGYERSVFVPDVNNWPDFRCKVGEPPRYWNSWCHGAPGIGLARLAALGIEDDAAVRNEIEAAISTTSRLELQPIDCLCCGNLGRIEFLLSAGRKLKRPELLELGGQQVATIIARAARQGSFALSADNEPYAPGCHPGFFQGEAGIGYGLLRFAFPELLPSVLQFE